MKVLSNQKFLQICLAVENPDINIGCLLAEEKKRFCIYLSFDKTVSRVQLFHAMNRCKAIKPTYTCNSIRLGDCDSEVEATKAACYYGSILYRNGLFKKSGDVEPVVENKPECMQENPVDSFGVDENSGCLSNPLSRG